MNAKMAEAAPTLLTIGTKTARRFSFLGRTSLDLTSPPPAQAVEDDQSSVHLSEIEEHVHELRRSSICHDTVVDETIIAKKETRRVFVLKCLVICLLVVVAIALSAVTFSILSSRQQDNYRAEFRYYANKILVATHDAARLTAWTAQSVAAAYTSELRRTPERWPNVTLWDFEQRVLGASHLAKADFIAFSPLVTNEARLGWEEYANEHLSWLDDSLGTVEVSVDGRSTYSSEFLNATTQANQTNPSFCVGVGPSSTIGCRHVSEGIWSFDLNNTSVTATGKGPFLPIWQLAPWSVLMKAQITMADAFSIPIINRAFKNVVKTQVPEFSETLFDSSLDPEPHLFLIYPVFDSFNNNKKKVVGTISIHLKWSTFFNNLFEKGTVRFVTVVENSCGQAFTFDIDGPEATFIGSGDFHDPTFRSDELNWTIGFDKSKSNVSFWNSMTGHDEPFDLHNGTLQHCSYVVHVYPTQLFSNYYITKTPAIATTIVACIFFFVITVFLCYDFLVERRQSVVLQSATKSISLINSLFPRMVRDRVVQRRSTEEGTCDSVHRDPSLSKSSDFMLARDKSKTNKIILNTMMENPKLRLKSFLTQVATAAKRTGDDDDEEPIAELFSDTTVMFADIAGFTAWSSEREPTQVFRLLETLYRAFDDIATRFGVFKIETIGDCYVAVAGLPDPNEHHAAVMTWFAYECVRQMKSRVNELEVKLGPGTSDLRLRVGLHSGPVTAGVLRGEKERFQLFGDTMNTAARMESTGAINLIHASYETAQLLIADDKGSWVTPRDGVVFAKGKGEMQTYWLKPRRDGSVKSQGVGRIDNNESSCGSSTIDTQPRHTFPYGKASEYYRKNKSSVFEPNVEIGFTRWGSLSLNESLSSRPGISNHRRDLKKRSRLVDWNVDLLLGFLVKVVSNRIQKEEGTKQRSISEEGHLIGCDDQSQNSTSILQEVTEVIELPSFEQQYPTHLMTEDVTLSPLIRVQLHDFVTRIAAMYRDHPFHNLEHASHVVMSAVKLMNQIITPSKNDFNSCGVEPKQLRSQKERQQQAGQQSESLAKKLYDETFGISYDPLTQFCVVFSALIHDMDHLGVPNDQLVKERNRVAMKFGDKSAAEQNSVYIAWRLLMEPSYEALRACIFSNDEERKRFRQLVVHAVMATDIMDKELQNTRKVRWEKAFKEQANPELGDVSYNRNRKATCVIEHIIQASDVAHTMQHWHIFRRWNAMLFNEMNLVYKQGRTSVDPSVGWYESQIGFFDYYVIPLAQKLKDSGVFGIAGAEYLLYAVENRREWVAKGREETDMMLVNFNLMYQEMWKEKKTVNEEENSRVTEMLEADDSNDGKIN